MSSTPEEAEKSLFDERFLLARPVLRALRESPAVLLVDEVDRADDEFEAFLLEVLSGWTVSIPELGTVTAVTPPTVVLTSNRTRELHDALKRRCLYHWIDHPGLEREVAIVRSRLPEVSERLRRAGRRSGATARATRSCSSRPASPRPSTGLVRCTASGSTSSTWRPRRAHWEPWSSTARTPTAVKQALDRMMAVLSMPSATAVHAPDEILLGFTRALRSAGMPVTHDRATGFLEAVAMVGADDPMSVFVAGQATLCASPDDLLPLPPRLRGLVRLPRAAAARDARREAAPDPRSAARG